MRRILLAALAFQYPLVLGERRRQRLDHLGDQLVGVVHRLAGVVDEPGLQ
ncbi:hypothetical protein [Amycolatopsis sp.]|nr:hypothetical protein [Amycolatopsis sp.]HVV13303.1 hypothetical protein [Amycolatopsis sp.]